MDIVSNNETETEEEQKARIIASVPSIEERKQALHKKAGSGKGYAYAYDFNEDVANTNYKRDIRAKELADLGINFKKKKQETEELVKEKENKILRAKAMSDEEYKQFIKEIESNPKAVDTYNVFRKMSYEEANINIEKYKHNKIKAVDDEETKTLQEIDTKYNFNEAQDAQNLELVKQKVADMDYSYTNILPFFKHEPELRDKDGNIIQKSNEQYADILLKYRQDGIVNSLLKAGITGAQYNETGQLTVPHKGEQVVVEPNLLNILWANKNEIIGGAITPAIFAAVTGGAGIGAYLIASAVGSGIGAGADTIINNVNTQETLELKQTLNKAADSAVMSLVFDTALRYSTKGAKYISQIIRNAMVTTTGSKALAEQVFKDLGVADKVPATTLTQLYNLVHVDGTMDKVTAKAIRAAQKNKGLLQKAFIENDMQKIINTANVESNNLFANLEKSMSEVFSSKSFEKTALLKELAADFTAFTNIADKNMKEFVEKTDILDNLLLETKVDLPDLVANYADRTQSLFASSDNIKQWKVSPEAITWGKDGSVTGALKGLIPKEMSDIMDSIAATNIGDKSPQLKQAWEYRVLLNKAKSHVKTDQMRQFLSDRVTQFDNLVQTALKNEAKKNPELTKPINEYLANKKTALKEYATTKEFVNDKAKTLFDFLSKDMVTQQPKEFQELLTDLFTSLKSDDVIELFNRVGNNVQNKVELNILQSLVNKHTKGVGKLDSTYTLFSELVPEMHALKLSTPKAKQFRDFTTILAGTGITLQDKVMKIIDVPENARIMSQSAKSVLRMGAIRWAVTLWQTITPHKKASNIAVGKILTNFLENPKQAKSYDAIANLLKNPASKNIAKEAQNFVDDYIQQFVKHERIEKLTSADTVITDRQYKTIANWFGFNEGVADSVKKHTIAKTKFATNQAASKALQLQHKNPKVVRSMWDRTLDIFRGNNNAEKRN